MKVSAIGVNYSLKKVPKITKLEHSNNTRFSNISSISFRGGNKNQVIYWGMELRPYNALGGISTVLRDHRGLKTSENGIIPDGGEKNINYWKQPDKVYVDPFYNGMEVYDYNSGLMTEARVGKIPTGLKSDSAFKQYEGMYFFTNDRNFKKYSNELEFFNNEEKIVAATGKPKLNINNNIHILKEVGEPINMDFGGDANGETPIRLFRVNRFDNATGKLVPINDFKIMTDVSATWQKPYDGGGYATSASALGQTWKGDGDARSSKAFVELLEPICKEVSNDGTEFKPATVLLNDSHAGNVVEYMAQKSVNGDKFIQDMKPELIVHNAGSGYIQKTSYMNMFVNIADKELRDAVRHDPEFTDAMLKGESAVNDYFRKLLPNEIIDAQGGVSPFQNTLYYADKGYVPKVMTVSEGYHDATVTNRDIVPGQFDMLNQLDKKGIYVGITNGSTGINPYSIDNNPYFQGYTFPSDIKEADKVKGKQLTPYKVFDKTKAGRGVADFDINHVREVKKHNKAALLERFDKDVLDALKAMQDVKGKEYEYASVIAASPERKVNVLGYIDKKYIEAAKKADSKVKLMISWGRGDIQKGLDIVLRSFETYAEKNPDALLVAGGEIPADTEEGKNLLSLIEKLNNNPKTKGRVVYMDGFAPNKPLIMAADIAVLPSRFAPCELTDLESIKGYTPTVVTNCQGLGQKNFDETFAGEAEKVTGYKTKHDFYMSQEELFNNLDPENKAKLEKDLQKLKDEIKHNAKHRYNKTLSDKEIEERILQEKHYDYIFNITRPYRDKVIEKELVECYERAFEKDYGKDIQAKMIKNGINMGIGWEDNSALSKYNKSSGALYREAFNLDNTAIKKEDTLLFKLRENCSEILENYHKHGGKIGNNGTFGAKVSQFFKSKGGKWTIAGIGVAAIGGLYYYGKKEGWFKTKNNADKQPMVTKKPKEEQKHLSAVV